MPEHGVDYARNASPRSKRPNASASAAGYLPVFQSRIASRLTDLVEEAHRQGGRHQGGGYQGEVSFDDTLAPGQLHPSTVSSDLTTHSVSNGFTLLKTVPAHIAMPEHGVDYARNVSPRSKRPNASAPAAGYLPVFQSRIASRLKDLIEEAHKQGGRHQGGGYQGEVSFGDTLAPGLLHPSTVSAAMPIKQKCPSVITPNPKET